MATTPKKFYWLKFKNDFFTYKEIKKLRRIAGGDTYTVIYLKMQLLSLSSEGLITFEKTESDIVEQLALELDEDYENIRVVLNFLLANKLLEQVSEDEYLLVKVPNLIGKETGAASRMRRLRAGKAKEKEEKSVTMFGSVTQRKEIEKRDKRKEIEKEEKEEKTTKKDKPKRLYLEFVRLSDDEYAKLCSIYPKKHVDIMISRLNDHIGAKGAKYKSHYYALRNFFRREEQREQK
jgi:predicted phage replisome organizer